MQTRTGVERRTEAEAQRESIGELLGQLANNSAALVRDEIELAKQEMSEKVSSLMRGIIFISVGGLVVYLGLWALIAAAIIALGHYVGQGTSALIIGALLAIVGGVVAFAGLGRLRRMNLKPQQTIETIEEDKQWLKELT